MGDHGYGPFNCVTADFHQTNSISQYWLSQVAQDGTGENTTLVRCSENEFTGGKRKQGYTCNRVSMPISRWFDNGSQLEDRYESGN